METAAILLRWTNIKLRTRFVFLFSTAFSVEKETNQKKNRRSAIQGMLFCEAPPLRSANGRTERPQRCSHHCDGPLSPGTPSCSAQLTCYCLFSLKKCQSVHSQVCCSSSCFCCFLPPTLPDFPCRLPWDQSDAAGRIWIFQVQREDCISHHLRSEHKLVPPLAQTHFAGPPGALRHKPGPPVWERGSAPLFSLSSTHSFYGIWTKNNLNRARRVGIKPLLILKG